ncbi:MAG: C-terminal helicase domain-containing protein, partial [Halobacterium sp.]
VEEVRRLADAGVDPGDVGVIAAYSAQVERVRSRLAASGVEGAHRATVDTVDSFQGGERDAVVVSFVRSNDDGSSGFLEFPEEGPRRLNVALTRARKRLVLVGDWDTLSAVSPDRSPENSCADVYAALADDLAAAGRLRDA